ncbi:MAG: Bacterial SH3 domain protein [Chlorobi bacterium OLB5]|nr:MAG: Bacterial SH3 domain protein [Chlorobi bacterium OLB5]
MKLKKKNPEDSSIEIFDGETAIINDPDGFTNIRYQPNTNSEILDKIIDGEEFQVIVDLSKDWWKVKTKKGIIGYVHKSRVRLFNEDKYNKPQTKKSFGGTFIDDTYKAQFVIDKFGKGTVEYSTSLFGGSIQQGIYTQSGNTLHFVFDSGRSNTVNISENESSYYFYIGETRYKKINN